MIDVPADLRARADLWAATRLRGASAVFAGVSGGRTSALMHVLFPRAQACFQNTGREHPGTLEFLRRLEEATRPIAWLEYVPPARVGAPPRESSFRIVGFASASRKGEPFRALLEAIRAYRREAKGLGPIAPWARQRICTSYLKIRVQRAFAEWCGHEEHIALTGLRADEPGRVAQMRARSEHTSSVEYLAPLHDLGITKADVDAFWGA